MQVNIFQSYSITTKKLSGSLVLYKELTIKAEPSLLSHALITDAD